MISIHETTLDCINAVATCVEQMCEIFEKGTEGLAQARKDIFIFIYIHIYDATVAYLSYVSALKVTPSIQRFIGLSDTR